MGAEGDVTISGPRATRLASNGKALCSPDMKSGCHVQERINSLLVFLSQILLKDAADDNLGELYSFANHMWNI